MGSRHRPGPRGRGHDGAQGSVSDGRTLVLPGDEIAAGGLRPGPGTYRTGGKMYASVLGLLQERPPVVRVVPLAGRYLPKAGDVIIGIVADVQGTFWLLDIGAPRWAPLHHTGTPWKLEPGETDRYLHVGDSVVVAVESLENTGRIGVTMLGDGLGKLEGGTLVTITPAKVPRVIGRGGSMVEALGRMTGCKLSVGQNGRIWIDGTPDGIERVRAALRMIENEGQRPGLTERVHSYLASTQERDQDGRPEPAPGEPPANTIDSEPYDDTEAVGRFEYEGPGKSDGP
jgi:exosome complex component RRP4